MKKYICAMLLVALAALSLTACSCEHDWLNATCTSPVICSRCEETAGDPLPHTWQDATCTTPKTCSVCKTTEGTAVDHSWENATCTAPKICSVCNLTEGYALGHSWQDATYTTPKTCSTCGETEGTVAVRACLLCSNSVSRSQTLYCSVHDCQHTNCPYPAKNVGSSWSNLCAFHCCQHFGCLSIPIGGTYYCGAHCN